MQQLSNTIDNINRKLGQAISWLALAMVVLMFFNVVSRYVFNLNLVWQQELIGFMHSIIFLVAAGYTLLEDKHVRVDVFYQNMPDKRKALIDMVGTVVFLFPICIAISYFSADFIINSWHISESSSEYNGMPGVFLLKTCIWIFTASLALQGISTICKSLEILRGAK